MGRLAGWIVLERRLKNFFRIGVVARRGVVPAQSDGEPILPGIMSKWPAPGSVDTRLSESRLHLELHGT
jgi:hypothetical protein